MNQLLIVIVVMLIQQALAYMSSVVLPNMAPLVAKATNADPNLIGYHTGIFYFAAAIWQLCCGGFIIRYGSIRMSQFSLLIIGIGLMIGVELVKSRKTKEPAVGAANKVVQDAFRKGLLLLPCGDSVIRFTPPLVIDSGQVDRAVEIFSEVLAST